MTTLACTIPTRTVTVRAIEDVTPGLRQVTFGGLAGVARLGLDDFFLVIRPRPGCEHLLDRGAEFADYQDLPEGRRPGWAYYTARRWRPDAGEIDAWFVLHDHDGPVSGWARHAEVGDRVALWGPRTSFEPPVGTSALLLVGDATGLGAFASILEGSDPSIAITVVVEGDLDLAASLPRRARTEIHRVDRADGDGLGGNPLLDAVSRLDLGTVGLYAYGAGESRTVTEIRTHLRRQRGLSAPQVQMVGYWRSQP